METHEMLDEVIKQELENLSSLPFGSKERQTAIDNLYRLYGIKLDESKIMCDLDTNTDKARIEKEARDKEMELREKQIKQDKIFGLTKIVVEAGLTIGGLIFYKHRFREGLMFEEKGVFTAATFRELRQKNKPPIK